MSEQLKEISVQVSDIEASRALLAACLNYFQAMDLADSQRRLHAYSESALTQEVERLKTRFDGYMSDFLLTRYENETTEVEDHEEVEEVLADQPLGKFEPPKQAGRIISTKELTGN